MRKKLRFVGGKKQAFILLCLVFFVSTVFVKADENDFTQQGLTIKGKVLDSEGVSVIGASVLIKGTNRGTITNIEGDYTLPNVPQNAILRFQYIGYVSQEITVKDKNVINIILLEDVQALDEVTVVAFGKQKKESVLASITTISPSKLKTPSSNLTTALGGQMAGLIAYQRTGEPGADNAEFFVRGVTTFGYNVNPLILIDNIELETSDLARLQPDDIESFSIMKDAAATALYGARGANGVILVKTKEGRKGKPKVNLRIENTISVPTQEIELADPITYMRLHNEAIITRNRETGVPMYSDEKIENTVPGSGSLVFPTTDWRDELLKNYAMNQRVNLSISGGGDVARYYTSASFSQDNGILKVDKNNNFNNNIDSKTYTLRSNVNIDVTKSTELKISLNGTFEDYVGPVTSGSDMYKLIMRSNPVLFPAKYPIDEEHQFVKHTLFGNAEDGQYFNPYAQMVRGYREKASAKLGAQLELSQKLNFITEGLSARGLFNTTRYSNYAMARAYNPFYYKLKSYDYLTEKYSVDVINPDSGTEYLDYSQSIPEIDFTTYIEGALNYNRIFDKHSVGGLLVFTLRNRTFRRNDTPDGVLESLPYRNVGLAGRFSYGYNDRYLGEFNFGYNGSERFAAQNRFGFYPSISAGWIISNEKFFQPLQSVISTLKLRASYGLVGNDNISSERFLYLSDVNMNSGAGGAGFGFEQNAYRRYGITVSRYSDPNITWEVSAKANYAVELSFFNDLNLVAEYFTEERKKILQTRSAIPTSMGLWATPRANLGEAKSHGMEFSLDYSKSVGKFWMQGRANFTYATSQYTVFEDNDYSVEWWKLRTGNPVNQRYGYIAEGLFIDDAEVMNSPRQSGNYMAGDIKYKDLNGDGVINDRDKAPIGYPTSPEIQYGFGASFGYKSWDLSFFFNGLARESFWIDYNSVSPFFNTVGGGVVGHNALAKFIADSYWSEDNRDGYAVWPRLSDVLVANNGDNLADGASGKLYSTWFMRDGALLRLKSLEAGYSLPENLIRRFGLASLRIYVTGTNLLCFSKFKLWDPEMGSNGLGYPIQRGYNMGINLTF
jgi:TonB-linked SusC/RagA family outer membrane protein